MSSTEEGFTLHVTVTIAPENVPQFLEAFTPAYKAVVAEPECTFFEVYQSLANPGELSWVENWSKSGEWFQKEQITKEYYKDYLAITEPMFIKPREAKIYKAVPGLSTNKPIV